MYFSCYLHELRTTWLATLMLHHGILMPAKSRRILGDFLESRQSSFRWQTCKMSLSSFYMDLEAVDSASSHVRARSKQCSIMAEV